MAALFAYMTPIERLRKLKLTVQTYQENGEWFSWLVDNSGNRLERIKTPLGVGEVEQLVVKYRDDTDDVG